jgi:hypothetical protein
MEQDDMEHVFRIPTKQKSTKKHCSGKAYYNNNPWFRILKNPNLRFYHYLFVWNRNSSFQTLSGEFGSFQTLSREFGSDQANIYHRKLVGDSPECILKLIEC